MSEAFTYIDTATIDFTAAPSFRKVATKDVDDIEVVTQEKKLSTFIGGVKESEDVVCKPGDKIVTGDNGERYRVAADKFDKVWEIDPENSKRYRSKSVIVGELATTNVSMDSPKGWGTDKPIQLRAGGVVVFNHSTNEIYAIAEGAMEAEWGRSDKNGKVFARVSNDLATLEKDLEVAKNLGEVAHVADIEKRIEFAKTRVAEVRAVETEIAAAVEAKDYVRIQSAMGKLRDTFRAHNQDTKAAEVAKLMYVHDSMVYNPDVQAAVVALVAEATAGKTEPTAALETLGKVPTPEGDVTVHLKHAVNTVVMDKQGNVALIKRAHNPGKGKWALPGGFIDPTKNSGLEVATDAALRELREEAGLGFHPESSYPVEVVPVGSWRTNRPFDVRSAWGDMKNQVTGEVEIRKGELINVTTRPFLVMVDTLSQDMLKAGDDADAVRVMNVKDIYEAELKERGSVMGIADHWDMIVEASHVRMKAVEAQIKGGNIEPDDGMGGR